MYFVTADEGIIPCKYDQGSDSFVVMKRDFDPDIDELIIICIDGEEEEIIDYEVYDETNKVFFIYIYNEDDDESDEDESEEEAISDVEMEPLQMTPYEELSDSD